MAPRATHAKSVAQQLALLAKLPVTTSATLKAGRMRWRADLTPSPLSRTYSVQIEYAPPRHPDVIVVSPRLELPDGVKELPHVYSGNRLCLCYPWQWKVSDLISATLVPWASEWLLHYELWKANDAQWLGGGHEP